MLSAEEELDLVNKLKLRSEDRWMQLLLRAKCKKVWRGGVDEGALGQLVQQDCIQAFALSTYSVSNQPFLLVRGTSPACWK
eukprot:scaffold33020_cov18-Tisochrysis_lutea.AAC.1